MAASTLPVRATTINGSIGITAAGGNLEVTLASTNGTGDVTLRTLGWGDVLITEVFADAHRITINSAGAIAAFDLDEDPNLLARDIVLTAEGEIGQLTSTGVPVNIQADTLSASSATGSIEILSVFGNLHVTSATAPQGDVFIVTQLGSLTVDLASAGENIILASDSSDVIVGDLTAAGLVFVEAAGRIIQTPTSIITGDDVMLQAVGDVLLGRIVSNTAEIFSEQASILDNNDFFGETMNLIVSGDVTMSAGSSTPYLPGTIGTLANCIEVEVGGTMFAGASLTPGVAIHLCGTTNGGLVVIVPGNGIVVINGRPVDPFYLQDERGSANYAWDLRRRFDWIEQMPLLDGSIHIPMPIVDERSNK